MPYNPADVTDRKLLAQRMIIALTDAGFTEEITSRGHEKVFFRNRNRLNGVKIKVYTSIEGNIMREKDSDAIRVVAVYGEGEEERGLFSASRVYRTGEIEAICARTISRMRDVWKKAWSLSRCNKCGAVEFFSKKHNKYFCAAICWSK